MTAPDPRLEEIESRLSKATPGRWANYGDLTHEIYPADAHEDDEPENIAHHVPRLADAEFIAHAPADVAYLLAGLRKAQDKLARVEGLAAEVSPTLGLDLSDDDDFDRGWHGARRVMAAELRAAVADATGGERG